MKSKFLNYLIIFLGISLVFQLGSSNQKPKTTDYQPIYLNTTKQNYGKHKPFGLKIYNNTSEQLTFKLDCNKQPFTINKTAFGNTEQVSFKPELDCNSSEVKSILNFSIPPQSQHILQYKFWSNNLFNENGDYFVSTTLKIKDKNYELKSNQFSFEDRGFFGKIWLNVFYKPVYNLFMYLVNLSPGKNLGLGIIFLTLLIRLALFNTNQKALKAQKKMAKIQPKLNKIREKHKNNQAKIAEETLKIWQEEKVNPMSGILPILTQLPVLIAIFYVVQAGINPDMQVFIYDFIKQVNISEVNPLLFGLNLTERNLFALPLAVALLQFIQIHLTQNAGSKPDDKTQAQMQKTMSTVMPALIAVFAASLPAGVGIYWAVSTLFGIGQQLIINKSK